jgi:hypothetical protein
MTSGEEAELSPRHVNDWQRVSTDVVKIPVDTVPVEVGAERVGPAVLAPDLAPDCQLRPVCLEKRSMIPEKTRRAAASGSFSASALKRWEDVCCL